MQNFHKQKGFYSFPYIAEERGLIRRLIDTITGGNRTASIVLHKSDVNEMLPLIGSVAHTLETSIYNILDLVQYGQENGSVTLYTSSEWDCKQRAKEIAQAVAENPLTPATAPMLDLTIEPVKAAA